MAYRVLKSQVGEREDFEKKVAQFVSDLNEWREHMRLVGQNPMKFQSYPAPSADPVVVQSITQASDDAPWEPSFEYFDDSPPPEVMLRRQQDYLIGIISQLEQAAVASLIHPAKLRLQRLRYSEIIRREGIALQEVMKRMMDERDAKLAALDPFSAFDRPKFDLIKTPTEAEARAEVVAGRSEDDANLLAEVDARGAKIDAIEMHAATLMDQVADLNAETIQSWSPAPFPT